MAYTKTDLAFSTFLNSLADNAGALATQVDNGTDKKKELIIEASFTSGAVAPVAGQLLKVYFFRQDDGTPTPAYSTGPVGTAAAAVTVEPKDNFDAVVTIPVTANASTVFAKSLFQFGPGERWTVIVWNSSGGSLAGTGNFVRYYYLDE